jgi:hypothetical protein
MDKAFNRDSYERHVIEYSEGENDIQVRNNFMIQTTT